MWLELGDVTSGTQRVEVEVAGLDVGVDASGLLGCDARVAPRLAHLARVQEVEGEQLAPVLRLLTGLPLDRAPDLAVELATSSKREALVGDVAREPVPEPVPAAAVRVDETSESAQRRLVAVETRRDQQIRCELEREAHPEHGQIPQSRPIRA